MACISSCSICGTSVCDADLCSDCERETARRALAGKPVDKESIKKAVFAKRDATNKREMTQLLKGMEDAQGRNNWKKYRDENKQLQEENSKLQEELRKIKEGKDGSG